MVFYLFDRWGGQIGTVIGVLAAKRDCEVNGEHVLTVVTASRLEKGQRIVYSDARGKFREYIVQEVEEDHADDCIVTTATCEDSLAELNGDYLVEKEPSGTASTALSVALGTSRWEVGTVDVTGSARFSFYHCTAREAVNEIAEELGGEVSATIEVSGGYVTARKVNITRRIGTDNGKRFAYRKDLAGITRTVQIDDVVTALYGYGKGIERVDESGEATGGFERKLTFGDINGGLDYVADAAALASWGRPDGSGGKAHVFGKVEFSDCEDKAELLKLTREELKKRSVPRVSYTANVLNLAAAGFRAEGVGEGDTVQIVDTAFEPPLRLSGRVLKLSENLLAQDETVITLGNIQPDIAGTILGLGQSVQGIKNHASSWDGAASISSAFIDAVVRRLNEEFDAGGSYKYESFEVGTIYSSVPLDENFKPKQTPATAFQLTGMGFRIASSVKSNGEFDWRTFGTGAGFTADELKAGTIRGGNSYWNLETGDFLLHGGSIRITDSNGNILSIDTADGFKLADKSGNIIAGTEIVNGKASFFVDKVGRGDSYVTLGSTVSGYGGMAYVQNGVPALEVTPIADSKGRNGIDFSYNNKHFMASMDRSLSGPATVITPPRDEVILDDLVYPRLDVKSRGGVYLGGGKYGFSAADGIAGIYMDETHYFQITSNGAYVRCGNKGFGWYNGAFSSSLEWS